MGSQEEATLRVDKRERGRIKMTSLATFLLLTVSSPLILGKPQYGAAPPVQTPVAAPVVQAPSQISCFTTQETIWDTQYIEKQKLVQVPYTDCQNVPEQQCKKVPEQQCQQEPYTASQQVCEDVHRKIPQRISRTVPKKTCGGGGGIGSAQPERQTSSGGGGYRSGSSSNELVFTGALGGSNSNSGSNVKSAPQTRAGGDAINFG